MTLPPIDAEIVTAKGLAFTKVVLSQGLTKFKVNWLSAVSVSPFAVTRLAVKMPVTVYDGVKAVVRLGSTRKWSV